ncbi:MAG: hypothetical protein F6J90_31340 [Moorea sp. SIOASIH]|nr:hypothetical protein [Moorena sp. SIOASIH]
MIEYYEALQGYVFAGFCDIRESGIGSRESGVGSREKIYTALRIKVRTLIQAEKLL